MAKKKKENTLSYLQMPLPSGGKYSKMTKVSFGGLNKRYIHDSGELSMESNISTNEYPYLVPSMKRVLFNKKKYVGDGTRQEGPNYIYYMNSLCGMFAFDNFIIVLYNSFEQHSNMATGSVNEYRGCYLDYITSNNVVYTGKLSDIESDLSPRSVIQFNVYDNPTDPVTGGYAKKLLIFPDKKSMDFEITEDNFEVKDMSVLVKEFTPTEDKNTPPDTASHNYYYRNSKTNNIYKWVDDESNPDNSGWKISIPPTMPNIKYATVHLSRVFGVDDDRVYASGFNDYTNWNLDTIDEYNEANAWCSPSQSNAKAGGNFTGITTFQNHVICFKQDFMHEIYNTKNPFRIQDIYAEGTIDNRTIQDVDGKLIFVSADGVKIYTGSNPRIIDYPLNMTDYQYAVSGTDNRNYYLYCSDSNGKHHLYVYDTFTEMWSEQSVESGVISFAHNKNGMYMLCKDGYIYKMDTDDYSHNWSFETDLITNKTVDIKHIKKLQMLVDIPKEINDDINCAADLKSSPFMKVYILYDDEEFDENTSHLVYSSNGKTGKFPIRVKPRKTANYGFKLHVEGEGYVKLYELEIFIEAGGDMYV